MATGACFSQRAQSPLRARLHRGAGSAPPPQPPATSRTGCPSSRFSFGGRVCRKLRPHVLPDDELLAATVPLDPSAPDSTFAVHADGVVALSVERYLDELRLWHDLDPSLLGGLGGRRWRRS